MHKYKWLLVLLGIGVLFVPFPTQLVSEWKIKVVDHDGVPLVRVHVEQVCHQYTYSTRNYCGEAEDSRQVTDHLGTVHFSAKWIWLSLTSRTARGLYHFLRLPLHGSVGSSAYLQFSGPTALSPSSVTLDSGPPPNGKIVLEPGK